MMGGSIIGHEPDVGLVKTDEEFWRVFKEAG